MPPNTEPANEPARKLLEAIQSGGSKWQTRREIAQRLGKRWLNPVDVFILDILVEQGLIAKITRPRAGIVAYTVSYRATSVSGFTVDLGRN